jgi:hypothetical protein
MMADRMVGKIARVEIGQSACTIVFADGSRLLGVPHDVQAMIDQERANEREACAKAVKSIDPIAAERIRARGEHDTPASRMWTEEEIKAAWLRAEETGRTSWRRVREVDDLENSWEHVRAALHGEEP